MISIKRVAIVAVAIVALVGCDRSLVMGPNSSAERPTTASATRFMSRANVGGDDGTIELWVKTTAADRDGTAGCPGGQNVLLQGSIRPPFSEAQMTREWQIGITTTGELWFRVSSGPSIIFPGLMAGTTICTSFGDGRVQDDSWHHVAAQRSATGAMSLYVDGSLAASGTGPVGTLADGSIPILRLGTGYPVPGGAYYTSPFAGFRGRIDELRMSKTARYRGPFTPASAPFATDPNTTGLWHFDGTAERYQNQFGIVSSGPAVLDVSGYSPDDPADLFVTNAAALDGSTFPLGG